MSRLPPYPFLCMLTFTLPGVPVTIHWSFLLVALFGIGFYDDPLEIAAWTLAVFGAVLLHESGHAYTAKAFGATQTSVTLFALGGYTTWLPKPDMTQGKRFLVSAAGSAVGIAAGLIIVGLNTQGFFDGFPNWAVAFFNTFILVGLFWGVLNWIPLLPLDGGHMLHHALAIFWPKQAVNITMGVSVVLGVGLIGAAFYLGETFLAFFLVFILISGLRSRPALEAQHQPQQPEVLPPDPQDGPPRQFGPNRHYQQPQPYRPASPTAPEEREPEPPAFPI